MFYFYINLFVSLFVLCLSLGKPTKEIKAIYFFIGFIFILLIGFRGNDDEYSRLYALIPTLDSFFTDTYVAISRGLVFAFIGSIIKSFNINSQGFLFFFAFSSIMIHLKYYPKFTRYYLLAFLFYLSHEVIFHEWIQIRAGLASAMVLPMVYYLKNENKKVFFMIYIVSSLIHYVSIISILLLVINRPLKTRYLFCFLCFSFIIYSLNLVGLIFTYLDSAGFLPHVIHLYLNWDAHNYSATLLHPKTLQQILTSFFIIFLLLKNNKSYSNGNFLLFNVYFLSTGLQIMFNDFAIFAFRFAGHFYSVEPIILTFIILFFKERKVLVTSGVALCLALSYINYVVVNRLDPYIFLVLPSSLKW